MENKMKWIAARIRLGWTLLAAGILVSAAGIFSELALKDLAPYNFRLVTGLGFLLLGGGIGTLLRYRSALKDAEARRRLLVEEADERTVLLRLRAGNRAYWASAALIYLGLLWASFAEVGDLPPLAGDTLWGFLAACVILPFGVYLASILLDQRQM